MNTKRFLPSYVLPSANIVKIPEPSRFEDYNNLNLKIENMKNLFLSVFLPLCFFFFVDTKLIKRVLFAKQKKTGYYRNSLFFRTVENNKSYKFFSPSKRKS